MSKAEPDVTKVRRFQPGANLRSGLEPVGQRLNAYRPPIRERHFWVVQGFVVFIAVTHIVFEHPGLLHDLGVPNFIPTTLFLVPVVYAAINFGLTGAIATALWATVLTVPNWVLWHDGLERFACMTQMLVVNAMAFFVGLQVNRKKSAQLRLESTLAALRVSEVKYRGLFESSPIAILVLDEDGTIVDTNRAAELLFKRRQETLTGIAVADLVGQADVWKLLGSFRNGQQPEPFTLEPPDGVELYIEPTLTESDDGQGNSIIQIFFKDVTAERRQQAGLREYAAYVLRGQEEERQRIARELHDGAIQQLALLHRQLSSLQNTGDKIPSSPTGTLQGARDTIEEIIRELRDFSRALRPPILEDLGLVASVRSALSDLTQRTALQGHMKVVGNQRRLSSNIELGTFRIAQEALRNVERHAKATHIVVTMTFAEHEVSLDVQDDGIGFAVSPNRSDFTTNGLGLISMRERAKLINGELKVVSNPAKGTRVIVFIPI
ncbi:MAG: PAS domain-containing sensor histidine kinase [Chloroflexi bacterium]|nr:PAS domain-containing sensor histidine kinase [Chloroflexota bacterium]